MRQQLDCDVLHTRGFSRIVPARSRRGPVLKVALSVSVRAGRETSRAGICCTESRIELSLLIKG